MKKKIPSKIRKNLKGKKKRKMEKIDSNEKKIKDKRKKNSKGYPRRRLLNSFFF